ncbi:uncharacterized protein LOC113225416 [Hyposmocoma kahamanoa]|uniref:uncharacterized protein LOC113225416 n=1 Tax=Hyposmocoma kahamanoa TaxID=1477025 RepID=UPI000E6D6C7C|nr:uncharacterized protein LOC113225416 [Hyposmocoma kahamanoa]
MLTKVFFLFAVLAAARAQTQVSQCISNPGDLPLNVDVAGCVTPPCALPQLEHAQIDIVFRAPRTTVAMRTLATAYLQMGPVTVPVPYDLGEDAETCNFLINARCPVLEGEVVSYRLRMLIESFMPVGTQTTVEFRIVDASNTNSALMCIRLPIRVEPPLSAALEGPKDESMATV